MNEQEQYDLIDAICLLKTKFHIEGTIEERTAFDEDRKFEMENNYDEDN